jgi:hypothetical protein
VVVYLLCPAMCSSSQGPVKTPAEERMYADVLALTSIRPPRNYREIPSLDKAAEYILGEFVKCDPHAKFQPFKAKENEYKNVIASFGPEDGDRIVIGAHYDVAGYQPGADDNASGVAVILELARLISTLKPALANRIDLVTFVLEEPPFFRTPSMGSAVYAKSLKDAGVTVYLMICVDMVGCFSSRFGPDPRFSATINRGEIIRGQTTAVIGKKGEEEITGFLKRYIDEIPDRGGLNVVASNPPGNSIAIDWSDHLNFWNRGYRAVVISNALATPNPNYHSPADTIDTLDFKKMAVLAKGIYRAITNI